MGLGGVVEGAVGMTETGVCAERKARRHRPKS